MLFGGRPTSTDVAEGHAGRFPGGFYAGRRGPRGLQAIVGEQLSKTSGGRELDLEIPKIVDFLSCIRLSNKV